MSDQAIAQLLQLEQQVRRCESATELAYVMVNLTRNLVAFEQAAFLRGNETESLRCFALSDVSLVDRATPYVAWLEQLAKHVSLTDNKDRIQPLSAATWPAALQKDLAEFSPPHLLWVPLMIPARPNQRDGVLVLAKSTPWEEKSIGLLQHLASSYAHGMQPFLTQSWFASSRRQLAKPAIKFGLMGALAAAMFIPVRLSVLAPAEVIAENPYLVTSPLAGAVKQVTVQPGEEVKTGQLVAELDKTEFQGAYEVAQREYERALAQLKTAEQVGFVDRRRKSELLELEAAVELRRTERDYAAQRLQQTQLKANSDGVAVLDDPSAWAGRPVVVGERILSVADPQQIELQVLVPSQDAIDLTQGNPVRFYLDTDPLQPLNFSVKYASFSAQPTPEQVVAYRVVASPVDSESTPRIGLKGTAKLYGEQVSLGYYLFRRPITYLRQSLGW